MKKKNVVNVVHVVNEVNVVHVLGHCGLCSKYTRKLWCLSLVYGHCVVHVVNEVKKKK